MQVTTAATVPCPRDRCIGKTRKACDANCSGLMAITTGVPYVTPVEACPIAKLAMQTGRGWLRTWSWRAIGRLYFRGRRWIDGRLQLCTRHESSGCGSRVRVPKGADSRRLPTDRFASSFCVVVHLESKAPQPPQPPPPTPLLAHPPIGPWPSAYHAWPSRPRFVAVVAAMVR